jgi:biofilm PGA synthesis lipoprotein PgaB
MARFGAPLSLCTMALLGILCATLVWAADAGLPRGEFIAIAYRSIQDRDPDQSLGALETAKLAEEFDWLRAHGYQPVTLDDLLAASRGGPLPPKPVLLTFDDGWENFYTRVLPLLQAFHYPAIVGVVATFASAAPGTVVRYGAIDLPRENFMTLDQIREVARSGLVEFAVQARERAQTGAENVDLQQLQQDLAAASDLVQQQTGRMVRAMIWPRRENSGQAGFLVTSLGLVTVLTLEPGQGAAERIARIPRRAVDGNPGMGEFIEQVLRMPPAPASPPPTVSFQPIQPATAR